MLIPGAYIAEEIAPSVDESGKITAATGGAAVGSGGGGGGGGGGRGGGGGKPRSKAAAKPAQRHHIQPSAAHPSSTSSSQRGGELGLGRSAPKPVRAHPAAALDPPVRRHVAFASPASGAALRIRARTQPDTTAAVRGMPRSSTLHHADPRFARPGSLDLSTEEKRVRTVSSRALRDFARAAAAFGLGPGRPASTRAMNLKPPQAHSGQLSLQTIALIGTANAILRQHGKRTLPLNSQGLGDVLDYVRSRQAFRDPLGDLDHQLEGVKARTASLRAARGGRGSDSEGEPGGGRSEGEGGEVGGGLAISAVATSSRTSRPLDSASNHEFD